MVSFFCLTGIEGLQTGVMLLVVMATGEGETLFFTPDFGCVIDTCTAVIAVELPLGKGVVFLMSVMTLNVQAWALLEERPEFYPAEATLVAVKVWTY
jgi:hypothetical protein